MSKILDLLLRQDKKRFWILLVCTALVIIAMQITGAPLKNEFAPAGIVSFELTGSLLGSLSIINSWRAQVIGWAWVNMILDFLFIVCYSLTIAWASLHLGSLLARTSPLWGQMGGWFARAILVAAGLDVLENLALIGLLAGVRSDFLALLARWCAIPKFALVAAALGFVILVLISLGISKLRGSSPSQSSEL